MKNNKTINEGFYLGFIDGTMSKTYTPFCPFNIPWTTVYQSMLIVGLIYKDILNLEEILEIAGHKMNEHALEAFLSEVNRSYDEIIKHRAAVEN